MSVIPRLVVFGCLVLSATVLAGCQDESKVLTVTSPLTTLQGSDVERGEYLARAGDCIACHTVPGQPDYSGGKAIPTPFGKIYTSNLTSDKETGLGQWTADDFWQALHQGKSRDGRSLYPAFPYPSYTHITRDDSDDLFAYLQTLEPVNQPTPENELRFPYNTQWALNLWRAVYFDAGVYTENSAQTDSWNRGAYLVKGLGHCSACHTPRGALGNSKSQYDLAGAYVEGLGWDALPLSQGSLPVGDADALVELLKTGANDTDVLSGPMAEVVFHSLQYLSRDDLASMVEYFMSLPKTDPPRRSQLGVSEADALTLRKAGEPVYQQHCADCHGDNGEGVAGKYPALAGNRGVSANSPNNAIRILLAGGFGASTMDRPRPYGMPPYAHQLDVQEAASVLSYIRGAWGNSAPAVSAAAIRENQSR